MPKSFSTQFTPLLATLSQTKRDSLVSMERLPYMLLSTFFVWISVVSLVESREELRGTPAASFSFTLVHKDAPRSVLRSSLSDTSDLPDHMPMKEFVGFGRALRARQLHSRRPTEAVNGRFSYLNENVGDFYLTAKVGTPPQEALYTLDTGSELIWMQCAPCKVCSQTEGPIFQSARSSSYLRVPCTSPLCAHSVGFNGGCSNASCLFGSQYGDGSAVEGYISVDTFHLGTYSNALAFGCAEIDSRTVPTPESGIMGLSAGTFSFASQLLQSGYSKKFAYCLPDRFTSLNSSGVIQFGEYSFSVELMYTPLVPPYGPLGNLNYYVGLSGISLGSQLLKIPKSAFQTKVTGVGGTILDSGTALTYLVESAYRPLVEAMVKATARLKPFYLNDTVCYKIPLTASHLPRVPRITFHFSHGGNLELEADSILYAAEVDGLDIVTCAAFASSGSVAGVSALNIIGNYQQQNLWIEYDLGASRVGFAKADCAMD